MDKRRVYVIARVVQVLGVFGALFGLWRLSGTEGAPASAMVAPGITLGVSAVVGIAAGIVCLYVNPKKPRVADQQKIALETLAKLGDKKR